MESDVPEQYALSFLIGEVIRNDVGLESEMRALWWQLHEAGLAPSPMQRDLGRLLKELRRALSHSLVDAPFREIALEVVQQSQDQHRVRNTLVHDQWVQLPWRSEEIASMRTATRLQLDELRACADALLVLLWRTRGVASMAPAWLRADAGPEVDDEELLSWTRIAMGHIAYSPGRIQGTDGPAPLPPTRSTDA